MAARDEVTEHTYGNWKRESVAGYFGLPGRWAAVFYGLLVLGLIGLFNRAWLLVALCVVAMLLVQVLFRARDRHNRHAGHRVGTWFGWLRQKRSGSNLYRSGPLGVDRLGRARLPGLSARSELLEVRDGLGREFCVLRNPVRRHYTVVLAAHPDGNAMVDQEQMDTWVAHWGQFLNSLSDDAGLIGFTVTIETSPDEGASLSQEVRSNFSEDAPEFALHCMNEVVEAFPEGASRTSAWLAFTFQMPPNATRDQQEFVRYFQSKLTYLTTNLETTGLGGITPVDAAELCEYLRASYDPAVGTLLDQAKADGESLNLDWEEVGPTAYDAEWDHFKHDSGTSVSWVMSQAPRGEVHSNVLEQLFDPVAGVERKRVTLIYRPIPSDVSAARVEKDRDRAKHRAESQRAGERQRLEYKQARSTESEEAKGAGLVRFGMIVTATTRKPDKLDEIVTAVESRASASSRIRLRRAWAAQASTFAAGLPIGIVLPEQVSVERAGKQVS